MRFSIFNLVNDQVRLVDTPSGRNPIRIGRDADNDIVLNSNFVASISGLLFNAGDGQGWRFQPLENDWRLAEQDLEIGSQTVVHQGQSLIVADFQIDIIKFDNASDQSSESDRRRKLDQAASQIIVEIHNELCTIIDQLDLDNPASLTANQQPRQDVVLDIERHLADIADQHPRLSASGPLRSAEANHFAGLSLRGRLLRFVVSEQLAESELKDKAEWRKNLSSDPELERKIQTLAGFFISRLELDEKVDVSFRMQTLEQGFWDTWKEFIPQLGRDVIRYLCLCQIRREIKDLMYGLGPLEELLENPTITEIMVNDAENIFIEKDGSIENSGRRFVRSIDPIIQKIASHVQRKIDTSEPMVDARLADGSRVNIIIKPLTVQGPCLTIRRFPIKRLSIERLVEIGALSPEASNFLQAAVVMRCNILVAGGTGTGKTTLLNSLSAFIPEKERIITIEDTAELRIPRTHVVSLETRLKNAEGKGAIDIRMLMKNALRMRPDRIIVGECRGGEALDMLQAMNTGHDGSMTTLHANSPADVVSRLEVMVQQNGDTVLPVASIHQQIASAIDIIIQLSTETFENPSTGVRQRRRFVSAITEVAEVDPDHHNVRLKHIFRIARDGSLRPTGCLPTFIEKLITDGGMKLQNLLLKNPAGIHS